jgi:hypothetical protein
LSNRNWWQERLRRGVTMAASDPNQFDFGHIVKRYRGTNS